MLVQNLLDSSSRASWFRLRNCCLQPHSSSALVRPDQRFPPVLNSLCRGSCQILGSDPSTSGKPRPSGRCWLRMSVVTVMSSWVHVGRHSYLRSADCRRCKASWRYWHTMTALRSGSCGLGWCGPHLESRTAQSLYAEGRYTRASSHVHQRRSDPITEWMKGCHIQSNAIGSKNVTRVRPSASVVGGGCGN